MGEKISLSPEYIKAGYEITSERRIYYNVEYDEFEER